MGVTYRNINENNKKNDLIFITLIVSMHNTKRITGTYKGLIGEILFVSANKTYLLTSFHPKHKYIEKMSIDNNRKRFLYRNWNSIDAISYDGKTIVEIKTRNYYPIIRHKPKASKSSIELMNQGKNLGFRTILALVSLKDNWLYEINIEEFNPKLLCIDKEKKYDRK